jgi:hypothetical protein
MPDTIWPEIGNTRQTHPGTKKKPSFDVIYIHFDTSSAIHSRSPS